ncbi:MAG: SUMF1/EgtB/PvdO family nonheme iron enzyme, partial [Anaerolineales bacterium]|nr:SUMF1/EgtB/PvdO family nonheme iron enzyme [Anaerolineales bacterium]
PVPQPVAPKDTPPTLPALDASELRRAYLNWLITQTSKLNLEGVNLRDAAQEKDARISLQAVYTALLTLTPEDYERSEISKTAERSPRRQSALAQLNEHKHLMLLGDPGSGKSTFVNFVTLCLAGAGLEHPEVNLDLLTSPLPDDEGKDEDHPQPWVRGALLPVRIILKDFVARSPLPLKGQSYTLEHLWKFISDELQKVDLGEYAPYLRRHLQTQGGLLLFDGLDEVPEARQRRQQIIQLVEAAASLPNCRVLVTSRVYAYRKQDWVLSEFAVAVLDSFSNGQIIRFVDHWYAHLVQLGSVADTDEAQRQASQLKESIFRNQRIYNLAVRPLLLTLIAGLHAWRKGKLPDKREWLYHEAVDLLLDRWQRRTIIYLPDGREEKQPSLEEFLKVGQDNVRRALYELAFNAHSKQPKEQTGTADILEKDLVYALLNVSPEKSETRPELLARFLRERAGLLAARGEGVYAFPHRTFQEYLAACHLTETDFPETLAGLACEDPERWREVTLLAAARVARTSDSYWSLAEALCCSQPPEKPEAKAESQAVWGAFLAGQLLAESANLARVVPRNREKLDRIRLWLVYILQSGALTPPDRAEAGNTLARLGDPRFDLSLFHLPFSRAGDILGFVPIPGGPFRMGSSKKEQAASENEKPQHELTLPDFYLGRYPVTVAQFKAYVDASGEKPRYARLEAPANHPLVNITWHEAVAYCRWLTQQLRALGVQRLEQGDLPAAERTFWERLVQQNWQATLPSEAEWEKAARGGLEMEAKKGGLIYPWGNDFDPDCANTAETHLGQISAVGCFPKGASPYGILDMSGNVWEWTRSLWGKSWQKPDFGYPYTPTDGREDLQAGDDIYRVRRGGSFNYSADYARCSFRSGYDPNRWYGYSGFRVGVGAPIHL